MSIKKDITKISVIVLCHLLLMVWGQTLFAGPNISLIWLPDGFLLAAFLLLERRLWTPLLLSAIVSTLIFEFSFLEKPPFLIFTLATANMIESYGAALLYTHFVKEPRRFYEFKDIVKFFLLCVLFAPAISAFLVAIVVVTSFKDNTILNVYKDWMLSVGFGILFFTPLTLYISNWVKSFEISMLKKNAPLFIMTLIASAMVAMSVLTLNEEGTFYLVFSLIVMPMLIYSSIEYGMFGAVIFCSPIVLIVLQFTSLGYVPINAEIETISSDIVRMQSSLATMVMISMASALASDKVRRMNDLLVEKNSELMKEKQFNESVTNSSTSGIYIHELKSKKHTYTNKRYAEILGWTLKEFFDMSSEEFYSLVHAEDLHIIEALVNNIKTTKQEQKSTYRIKHKNGHYIWCYSIDTPYIINQSGEVESIIGSFYDISDLVESKSQLETTTLQLEDSNHKLNAIIESIPGAVFNCLWDDPFSMNYISPYIKEITGYANNEFYPKGSVKYVDIINASDLENIQNQLLDAFANDDRYIVNYRIKTKAGEERWIMENGEFNKSNGTLTIDGVIIDVTRQIRQEERLIEEIYRAEDMTRHDISRDLHEGLQQALVIAKMNIESVLPEVKDLSLKTQTKLNTGYDYIIKSINESRSISHSLVPKTIKDDGLVNALTYMLDNVHGETKFYFHHNLGNERFKESLELGIYRIAQECLNNILRHAQAKEAIFQLNKQFGSLCLTVEDDGIGFSLQEVLAKKRGFGYMSMKSRVSSLGGYIDIDTKPGKGTMVIVEIPVE